MRRFSLIFIFVALQACASVQDEGKVAISFSPDAYAPCAACHLADGVGIPGAFPPLRNRVAAIATLEGGQDFLITVVSYGLMGKIEAGNLQYFGVMPGNKGPMSDEEIAAALNYAIFELVDDMSTATSIDPITAAHVEAVHANTTAGSPAAAAALRKKLVACNGEKWPE